MGGLKVLLRRLINRARVSPNPLFRWGVDAARWVFRLVGAAFPGLHLGWMSALRSAHWDGDDLVLRGWSFVRGTVHGGAPRHDVYLRRAHRPVWLGGCGARAETRHVVDPDVLGGAARAELDYSGGSWEARFPGAALASLPVGRWRLETRIVGGRRRSWGPVRRVYAYGSPITAVARRFPDRLVGPRILPGVGAFVDATTLGIPALAIDVVGRDVTIAVAAEAGSRLGQAVLRGDNQTDVPLVATADGDRILLAGTLPAGQAVVDPDTGIRYPPRWIAQSAAGEPITLIDDALRHRPDQASALVVSPSNNRAVEVIDVPHFVEIETVVRDDRVVRLTGSVVGDPTAFHLVLAAPRVELPVTIDSIDPTGRFDAHAPLELSTWGGPRLPAMRGAYVLEGRSDRAGDDPFTTFVSDTFIATLPVIDARTDLRLRFEVNRQPQFLLRITRPRARDEYGAHNQRLLFQEYATGQTEPLDAVYLESFFGRSATCNPRAIDAEIAHRRPDLPRYWSVDDHSVAVPEGATPLVIGTREWWRVRESARWIVTNEWLRGRYVKKDFQTVLQTWHGSMYKRIGIDRAGAGLRGGGHVDRARTERANWDLFISQNGDTTPIIQQAYEFGGADADAVLEIGYPRNGELTDIRPERVAEIRRRVGIPEGARVVLYAPTWREASQEVELLDLVSLSRAVAGDFVFLQRGHVRTLAESASIRSASVIDVGTYPQVNDLFMITDLLITDYSSMMFDFSVTGRPMLFYTPDFEEYTDPRVRGVYFDLEELAPGPVVRTVPEVVSLVDSLDDWAPTYADRYAAWKRRFNHLDDGHAAERAVDALFAFDPAIRSASTIRRLYDPSAGEES